MKIGRICTTCQAQIDDAELVVCERCGRELHEPCEAYETTFECERCGDDLSIGAVEF